MRRQHLTQLIGTLVVVAALIGLPTAAFAVITGSVHDLKGETYTDEICNVCHTPHNATSTVTAAPLWDHAESAETFTVYSSATLDAAPVGQPSGVSKLCLSCHDGSVAIDSFGGTVGTDIMTGTALVGSDLSNDHPISFTYDTALATADGELHDPATATTELTGTIADDLLFGGNMECSSCHDVHNAVGNTALLQIDNDNSDLCLTCHNK
ncbi:MAG: cytochrome C [Deltaproteobacteria bacterium]|nr:cytochrome C [Deltaproteobacteria bacterium]